VIYSVTDKNAFDADSRVNTFVHVTNGAKTRNGILLCINGTGILNRWLNNTIQSTGDPYGYQRLNEIAAQAPIGSAGLIALPFGNGAERILKNKEIGASFHGIDFNQHHQAHLFRAAQEGIVFSLKYGFDILEKMGSHSSVIRAGNSNMFLSPLFREAFVNTTGARLELYDTDGAKGAALGAGIGAGIYSSFKEAFEGLSRISVLEPDPSKQEQYGKAFLHWRGVLESFNI
jgi:xylulokinase